MQYNTQSLYIAIHKKSVRIIFVACVTCLFLHNSVLSCPFFKNYFTNSTIFIQIYPQFHTNICAYPPRSCGESGKRGRRRVRRNTTARQPLTRQTRRGKNRNYEAAEREARHARC